MTSTPDDRGGSTEGEREEVRVLQGGQLVAGARRAAGATTFRAHDPASGQALGPKVHDATNEEVAAAVEAASRSAADLRERPPADLAVLLRRVADRIEAVGDVLLDRARAETGLPDARLEGERARTCGQLRLFADVVEDGAHLDVVIDHADPDATPPRPDLRRMMVPLGPVAVFGASNFPLAFGVPGGDTASALAAGCPVVAKAHPSNPGTSELVGGAVDEAVRDAGFPDGTFSLLQGAGTDVGAALVTAPGTAAVGFTGSLQGGRALFDLAVSRPDPIPVYAEMGSVNPVWVAATALERRGGDIAEALAASVALGTGQFCTKPGVVFLPDGPVADRFVAALAAALADADTGPMLNERIATAYRDRAGRLEALPGVTVAGRAPDPTDDGWRGRPTVLACDLDVYRSEPLLREECFGPLVVAVTGPPEDLLAVAATIDGSLAGAVHSDPEDAPWARRLAAALVPRVGRLVHDGFPTGVAVTWAMHHGGPYPATTSPLHTSVGATAIRRFLRPITFQATPPALLPPPLQDDDPWRLPRRVDGRLTLPATS